MITSKNGVRMQYMVAVCVSAATITMGMVSGWPTPVLIKFKENETAVHINKNQIAWMLAMSSPGFITGSFVGGFTSDKVGRRATMLWSAVPYYIGMIIVVTAVDYWWLYATQFLWQCGTGMLSTVLTLYLAEISNKEIRGRVFLVTRVTFNLGHLLMMCIGPFVSYKTLNYIMLVLPVCYFVACLCIPESPYYYLKEKKTESARKALRRLKACQDEAVLEEELNQLQAQVKNEMRHSTSPVELFVGKQYQKAIIIAAGLKLAQIMSGMVTIQQYLGLIMEESDIKWQLPVILIIFGTVKFCVSVMPSFLIDRYGRRPLLIWSFFGTGTCLAIVGIYFYCKDFALLNVDTLSTFSYVAFICIISTNLISSVGYQALAQIIPGEIFPLNVKAAAIIALNCFGGLLSFMVARGYQLMKDWTGLYGVFWFFAAVTCFGAVFSIFVVPETKGLSLREIQERLQGHLYEPPQEVMLNNVDVNGDANHAESTELEELNKKEEKA